MAAKETQIELIEFQNPADNRLYIPKINWPSDDQPELKNLIKDTFSVYGLVHVIHVEKGSNPAFNDETLFGPSNSSWYAYISFYSAFAAKQARIFLHNNLMIEGTLCRVMEAKNRQTTHLPLAVHRCIELANYYVGFNGWSSQVIYNNLETSETEGHICNQMYAIGMRLLFRDDQVSVDGVGLSTAEIDISVGGIGKRANAIAVAQKSARSAALMNAFQKLILVVVDNKKVTVRVNTTKVDPFYYNPLWDEEKPLVVNVLDDLDEPEEQNQQI